MTRRLTTANCLHAALAGVLLVSAASSGAKRPSGTRLRVENKPRVPTVEGGVLPLRRPAAERNAKPPAWAGWSAVARFAEALGAVSIVDPVSLVDLAALDTSNSSSLSAVALTLQGTRKMVRHSRAAVRSTAANTSAAKASSGNDTGKAGTTGGGMLGFDVEKFSLDDIGYTLWVFAAITGVTFLLFELFHRRWADVDLSMEIPFRKEQNETRLLQIFHGVWPLVSPYLCSGTGLSRAYIITLIVMNLVTLGQDFLWTLWMKDFWDAMQHKTFDKFYPLLILSGVLAVSGILLGAYQYYIECMLKIDWRRHMTTELLDRWLAQKAFYRLQLDPDSAMENPDQRIQEDISLFIDSC